MLCRLGLSLVVCNADDVVDGVAWLEIDLARRVTVAAVIAHLNLVSQEQNDTNTNQNYSRENTHLTPWSSVFARWLTFDIITSTKGLSHAWYCIL